MRSLISQRVPWGIVGKYALIGVGVIAWPAAPFLVGAEVIPGWLVRFEGWLKFTAYGYWLVAAFLLLSGLLRWSTPVAAANRVAVCVLLLCLTPFWRGGWDTRADSRCGMNLTALNLAFEVYTWDHHGRFPHADRWPEEIAPYLTFVAPSVPVSRTLRCPEDLSLGRCSYGMNSSLSGRKAAEIKDAANTVLIYETARSRDVPYGDERDLCSPRHMLDVYLSAARGKFNNFVFADFHILNVEHPPPAAWHW